MAGGPLFPHSAYPVTAGSTFPYIYTGAGAGGSLQDEGMGVAASLAADSTWRLRFAIPPAVPTGIAKLRLLALASATTGTAQIQINDAVVAAGSSPSAATLTAETLQTLTWTAVDVYNELKVTLTPTAVANSVWVVDLVFKTLSWTLAAPSCWQAFILWE